MDLALPPEAPAILLRRKEGVVKQLVNGKPELISVEEMKTAEVEILKHVQKQSFVEELRCA